MLMQYEIELMYTFEPIAFKFICMIFFYQMIMIWKIGIGQHFLITANSL